MSSQPTLMAGHLRLSENYRPKHFIWEVSENRRVATVRLKSLDRASQLTVENLAELRDLFRDVAYASDIRVIILTGLGNKFAGADLVENTELLPQATMVELSAINTMTLELVKAMKACPQPVVAAIDGICAGVNAIIALSSDIRLAALDTKTAFRFARADLAEAEMIVCGILPRIIGQGRAAEILFTGRFMTTDEGHAWGFFNAAHSGNVLEAEAVKLAHSITNAAQFKKEMTIGAWQHDATADRAILH